MDKRLVLAVAGAGKTSSILDRIEVGTRVLVITHTHNAEAELRRRVLRKFGCMPPHVSISTYFSFLYRFCYRPILHPDVCARGMSFHEPSVRSSRRSSGDLERYYDSGRWLYHCRLARLIQLRCLDELIKRLEKYFDLVVVDEVQDFGAHDFNLLMDLSEARVEWYLVGDFYQHTFDTSRDGNVNCNLYADYDKYVQRYRARGFLVDATTLRGSHRCGRSVCEFISKHLGIEIYPASERQSGVHVLRSPAEIREIHADDQVLKLFYKQHNRHACKSMNWGESKGLDGLGDVCVVLNKTSWVHFDAGRLSLLPPTSRNRLYVASSRPSRNLFIAPESRAAR